MFIGRKIIANKLYTQQGQMFICHFSLNRHKDGDEKSNIDISTYNKCNKILEEFMGRTEKSINDLKVKQAL
jgi:hypothetical protein